jgi:hypothetical protein
MGLGLLIEVVTEYGRVEWDLPTPCRVTRSELWGCVCAAHARADRLERLNEEAMQFKRVRRSPDVVVAVGDGRVLAAHRKGLRASWLLCGAAIAEARARVNRVPGF